MKYKLRPCSNCGDAWLFVSDGGYTSGYEHYGYRVDCICHKAWDAIGWCATKEEAYQKWNGCEVEQ